MKRYSVISHPSDMGIATKGKSLKEAFENAAFGMMDVMYDMSKAKPKEKAVLSVEGDDIQSLLVNWLNELLYLSDARRLIISKFKISKISDKMLEAVVWGEVFDPSRHAAKTYIKAATFDQIEVSKKNGGYSVRLIFDV